MKKLLFVLGLFVISFTESKATCQAGYNQVIIQIIPDSWPAEISWDMYTSGGTLLANGGSVGDTVCVAVDSCIVFTIYDSYGDGIFSPGGYWLYLNGSPIASGGNYGSSDVQAIACPAGMYCNEPLPLTYGDRWTSFDDTWYTFTPDSNGIYVLSTCDSNTCNTQVWVYTACPPLPYTDGPMGSFVYNDDNCGLQASSSFMLVAGTDYLIRIGDKNNDCADSIHFNFSYSGPVTGCMDPASCTFNPLATVSDSTACAYYPNPLCQGPDLRFDSLSFLNSLQLQSFNAGNCDVAEGCVTGYGQRYVIAFTSKIDNVGTLDYYIGTPSSQPGMFNTNNCHGHAHYEGYGDYRLYDTTGFIVPAGHKNGYCVMDLCGFGQYTCGNMGISAGCYDVYGIGTQCQWVDITDVPDGDYRLAILINAQHLPDALGRYETNHLNNALQICIRITRNSSGIPSYVVLPNCTPFVDCNGTPGGVAEYDCNGVCGGSSVYGDLNADAVLNQSDINTYMDQVQSVFAATPCNDLNADGQLNIFDVAQTNWCVYGNPSIQGGSHNHCRFPRNIISNLDITELSIYDWDQTNNYIDIALKNPRTGVKGFQFAISGIAISSYVSLVNPGVFPVDLRVIPSLNQILAFGQNDSTIPRSTVAQPIVRIYYSAITDTAICISSVQGVMNERGEGTITILNDNCRSVITTSIASQNNTAELIVMPNPANHTAYLHIKNGINGLSSVSLSDVSGKQYTVSAQPFRNDWYLLDLQSLPSGIYIIRVLNNGIYGAVRMVKL